MLDLLSPEKSGYTSICSAHEAVLRVACRKSAREGSLLLVESTSNQVDQYGGYTGMTPAAFVAYIQQIAAEEDLPATQLILGGDHLGPNAWQGEAALAAMEKAGILIRRYIEAGYRKIHLDASMPCKGDRLNSAGMLDVNLAARRAADLCLIAERFADKKYKPWYVIGTDVPVPGGAQEDLRHIRITPVSEVKETLAVTKKIFFELGLESAWERVIAVVVQPGVEFGDDAVIAYNRQKARALTDLVKKQNPMVYEAHSTDYQTKAALKEMVQDGFAILKVGPWLTYAYREAVFALAQIENELLPVHKSMKSSRVLDIIDRRMSENPVYWQKHYHGNAAEVKFKRMFSLSDRIRYYWPDPPITAGLKNLIANLTRLGIPLTILSQYLPRQYEAVREGILENNAGAHIEFAIARILERYAYATGAMGK